MWEMEQSTTYYSHHHLYNKYDAGEHFLSLLIIAQLYTKTTAHSPCTPARATLGLGEEKHLLQPAACIILLSLLPSVKQTIV